jgi:hypothetical protein
MALSLCEAALTLTLVAYSHTHLHTHTIANHARLSALFPSLPLPSTSLRLTTVPLSVDPTFLCATHFFAEDLSVPVLGSDSGSTVGSAAAGSAAAAREAAELEQEQQCTMVARTSSYLECSCKVSRCGLCVPPMCYHRPYPYPLPLTPYHYLTLTLEGVSGGVPGARRGIPSRGGGRDGGSCCRQCYLQSHFP